MMTRASFSQKTMEWIVHLLKEASKTKVNSVKRWKNHDHYSEIFCSRNFNRFGRYFSIINLQGKKKKIIIVPEWSFNSGWLDIATKITNFINIKTTRTVKLLHRTTEEGLLYAEAVKNNKWSTREMNDAGVNRKGNSLFISEDARKTQNELLDRSVVGSLSEEISNVHLAEIRRWANSSWKQHHGIYIYEMGRNQFLFEFPTKTTADHVVKGEWFWKSHKFHLDWWTPCSNSIEESLKEVWIRLVGLPLQFWSQKILREIGNLCGGWIQTEEETELRNHLKWARIKVRGDEESVPKTVELIHDGSIFKVQIWIEAPARLVNSGQRGKKGITQQSMKKPYFIEDGQTYQRSRERDEGLDTRVIARAGNLNEKREFLGWGNLGHDPVAQIGFKEGEGKNAKGPVDPFIDEIIANQWQEAQASQHIRGENIFDTSSGDLQSKGEELDQELQDATQRDDDAMSIIQMDSRLEIDIYAEQGNKELGAVNVEEATPLNYTELPENFKPTSDSTIPLWVRQNIINLGKEFGIHFNGCEEIAEELFMKIDGKRQRTGEEAKALMLMTPKSKVSKELKNLEVGTNFFSYGTRSRGGCNIVQSHED
ncbi:hypothetical protein MTR67_017973 [Solanum verrucosum]|uniref:DUF4283 domain-containing protein n=1 Tax=Solanum verrucosum TaxID=315347 RepID=A0AAF0QLJ8_SOLVR|nr:hypothetical protein MTR67_017973 [Solanum verrucosum]